MAVALEGHDRFMLANRWRLAPGGEAMVERYVWPLLSYQPAPAVKIERARWEYDTLAEAAAAEERLEGERAKLAGLLEAQLGDALSEIPETAYAGSF